jgi:hypothetical protein
VNSDTNAYDFEDDEPRYIVAYDGIAGVAVEAAHPDRWQVRDGVNYVAAWRAAQSAADRLAAALARCGVEDVRCVPFALADGSYGVDLWVPARWAAWFGSFLEALRERTEAFPHIRGPDAA